MNIRVKAAIALATLLVGGSSVGVLVGIPAQNALEQLEHLREAQEADDAQEEARQEIASTRTENPLIQEGKRDGSANAQDGGRLESEDLQDRRSEPRTLETAHIANWIAIENLRAATAVYFLTFVVGIASIIGLLATLFSISDTILARQAARPRIGIRVTASAGDVAEFDVFASGDRPLWLDSISNLNGDDLRLTGAGLTYLGAGDVERAGGSVSSPRYGEGIRVEYADAEGTKRHSVFKLRKIGSDWCIVERQE